MSKICNKAPECKISDCEHFIAHMYSNLCDFICPEIPEARCTETLHPVNFGEPVYVGRAAPSGACPDCFEKDKLIKTSLVLIREAMDFIKTKIPFAWSDEVVRLNALISRMNSYCEELERGKR
jgi:hypothetical protein